ncbi:MAG: transglycosylase SLT domain-containing protein [Firmicutes bacterium]|nr:transglycosylase SLT domain-containing protein [Bacillota bacterium]
MVKRVAMALSLLAPLAAAGKADRRTTYLYTYYDRNGNVVINNLPPSYVQGQGLTLKHVGVGHVRLAVSRQEMARVLRSPELLGMVDEIAQTVGVDPYLARAIIQAESAFNYKARSRAGALGLMQLMPATAERFGVVDPFDPRQNITGGTKYLKWLMDYYKGDLTRVVAAYNAGEGAVNRHKGIPPFKETRAYVPKVLDLYNRRLVQPDPKAAGSMALLKRGRGGFEVDEEKMNSAKAKQVEQAAAQERKRNPLYQWTDSSGRIQISDQPPPKGAKDVKVYGGASD